MDGNNIVLASGPHAITVQKIDALWHVAHGEGGQRCTLVTPDGTTTKTFSEWLAIAEKGWRP